MSTASSRALAWGGLMAGFAMLVGIGVAGGAGGDPRIAYLLLLFALCTSPLLLAERLNGPYALLGAFMAVYFLMFGGADLADLFVPIGLRPAGPAIDAAELMILSGAVLVLAGYMLAVRLWSRRPPAVAEDWAPRTTLMLGLLLWGIGFLASAIWNIIVIPRAFDVRLPGQFETLAVLLGRVVHPVGLALLAYHAAKARNRRVWLLVGAVLVLEYVLGFVSDTKEAAFRGLAVVLVAKILVDGRLPKAALVGGITLVMLSFPVFQAYRTVTGEGVATRAESARDISRTLGSALRQTKGSNDAAYGLRSFLARSSHKPTIRVILDKVGHGAKYQDGYTLYLVGTSFIPRAFWPDKPDTAIGQLFNRELHISEFPDVYISVTQLGELYWNYGWLGVVLGMPLFGVFLGSVNARFDMSRQASVTRFVVLVTTVYFVCVRFEDGIAMTVIQWARAVAAVGLLHLLFAHRRHVAGAAPAADAAAEPAGLRFPNLLR